MKERGSQWGQWGAYAGKRCFFFVNFSPALRLSESLKIRIADVVNREKSISEISLIHRFNSPINID